MQFKLISKFKPTGDQPLAIKKLVANLNSGAKHQTLLGVTGSGKTFTVANVIEKIQKPTLVISHNKTLAAQLYQEFKEFFPENAVHYFVSYYDYYQPEAYMPTTDTYIEKDAKINEVIDALRHASTSSLLSRKDVIIVASVSCIYGLGSPEEYEKVSIELKIGDRISQKDLLKKLVMLQYTRNPLDPRQGHFRTRENTVEIYLPSGEEILQIAIEKGKVMSLKKRSKILDSKFLILDSIRIFPAKHFVTPQTKLSLAVENIRQELKERLAELKEQGKVLEAARLKQRTEFDLEMLSSAGYVNGIENYSRHLDFRTAGTAPFTLLDYFHYASNKPHGNCEPKAKQSLPCRPACRTGRQAGQTQRLPRSLQSLAMTETSHNDYSPDFLTIIDESHATLPQFRGMYQGDASRKQTLVDYGFRLPSARDNRPLKFNEFKEKIGQTIYMSATPADYELSCPRLSLPQKPCGRLSLGQEVKCVIEQLIRPTGILDPEIEIRPTKNQMKDVIKEVKQRSTKSERSLVLTLTKRLAEDVADYLAENDIKAEYLHSEVKTFERTETLKKLRTGEYDVLVGINLLREGLDLPEVSFIAILDADKEGFLRNKTTLLQIIGRAARHTDGKVILYADQITGSIREACEETDRRRKIQRDYNKKNNITPKKIEKEVRGFLETKEEVGLPQEVQLPKTKEALEELEFQMRKAAKRMDFETAAKIRDRIKGLQKTS